MDTHQGRGGERGKLCVVKRCLPYNPTTAYHAASTLQVLHKHRPDLESFQYRRSSVWQKWHSSIKAHMRTTYTVSNHCLPVSHHVCATVKRLCLWMLLLSSMRRSRRGELRGERRGEMEEGDRRCPRGLSGCSRFSRRIFTRSSFSPECLGMGGTARVSWWVTPMPACWAMPGVVTTGTSTTTTSPDQLNEAAKLCQR